MLKLSRNEAAPAIARCKPTTDSDHSQTKDPVKPKDPQGKSNDSSKA